MHNAYSVPVPQLVNYRYTVVQLRPKRSLLHRNNIRDFHTRTPNEKFIAFSPSDYLVSILTSSTLLSCHSGSTATADNDVILIFQDGGRGRSILLPVSYLLMLRSKSIKPYFVDINRQHYINLWLRYNDFWFGKQMSTILEFYFRFRSPP